jgi:hypothetical protein
VKDVDEARAALQRVAEGIDKMRALQGADLKEIIELEFRLAQQWSDLAAEFSSKECGGTSDDEDDQLDLEILTEPKIKNYISSRLKLPANGLLAGIVNEITARWVLDARANKRLGYRQGYEAGRG